MPPPQTQRPPEAEAHLNQPPLQLLMASCTPVWQLCFHCRRRLSFSPSLQMLGSGELGPGLSCSSLTPGVWNTARNRAAPHESMSDGTTLPRYELPLQHITTSLAVLKQNTLALLSNTRCNQDCWKKHQLPQICRWYHTNGRKWRGTKEPLDEGEKGEWKSWINIQHWKN